MKPRITVSDVTGRTVSSRRGREISATVDGWASRRNGRELELLEALRLAIDSRQLYIAGCICDDLGLNFAYSY